MSDVRIQALLIQTTLAGLLLGGGIVLPLLRRVSPRLGAGMVLLGAFALLRVLEKLELIGPMGLLPYALSALGTALLVVEAFRRRASAA